MSKYRVMVVFTSGSTDAGATSQVAEFDTEQDAQTYVESVRAAIKARSSVWDRFVAIPLFQPSSSWPDAFAY